MSEEQRPTGPGKPLSAGAKALADHQRTTGMAVSMGWTCRCGFYGDAGREQFEHQAEMVRLALAKETE